LYPSCCATWPATGGETCSPCCRSRSRCSFSLHSPLPDVINQVTLTNSSQRLVCANKASIFYTLPQSYRRRILALPHVKAVVGETYFGGMYQGAHDQRRPRSTSIN